MKITKLINQTTNIKIINAQSMHLIGKALTSIFVYIVTSVDCAFATSDLQDLVPRNIPNRMALTSQFVPKHPKQTPELYPIHQKITHYSSSTVRNRENRKPFNPVRLTHAHTLKGVATQSKPARAGFDNLVRRLKLRANPIELTHADIIKSVDTGTKSKPAQAGLVNLAPGLSLGIAQVNLPGVEDTFAETNKLRQQLLIDPITTEVRGQPAPASSAGTPTGYGASWRQAFVGAGLYFPFDDDRIDGSVAAGFGVGDAIRSVGVEFDFNFTSVGTPDDFDFGDSGSIGFKIHKYFSNGTAVAIGWSNPVKWGDVNRAKDTIYGVVTKAFDLQPNNPNNRMPLTVSLGVGSGVFRSKGAIAADENSVNIFGSLGLRVAPQVSLISSWTGNSLNVGGSFAPLRNTPLVINAIFTDVTNNFDRGTGLSLSAGYVFQF